MVTITNKFLVDRRGKQDIVNLTWQLLSVPLTRVGPQQQYSSPWTVLVTYFWNFIHVRLPYLVPVASYVFVFPYLTACTSGFDHPLTRISHSWVIDIQRFIPGPQTLLIIWPNNGIQICLCHRCSHKYLYTYYLRQCDVLNNMGFLNLSLFPNHPLSAHIYKRKTPLLPKVQIISGSIFPLGSLLFWLLNQTHKEEGYLVRKTISIP